MKNLKTKICLSVLALACLGAGTLTLQNNVSAKAEETGITTALETEFRMKSGAAICLENNFSGIRWATGVAQGYANGGADAQFGVLVAPTKYVGAEGVTFDTPNVLDLDYAKGAIDTREASVTYYSVIDYNEIAETYQQEAYALELTARAYVKYDGKIVYSYMSGDTSRSARQIAINAELTGQLDKYRDDAENETDLGKAQKAVNYYGGTQVTAPNAVATNSFVVDQSKGEETVDIVMNNMTLGDNYEVIIGSQRVDVNYTGTTLTVPGYNVSDLKIGEQYLTVFNGSTPIVRPIVYATKVLTKADDLAMFSAKGEQYDKTTKILYWAKDEDGNVVYEGHENQVFSGYYVLGQDIDASNYVHGSRNSATLLAKGADTEDTSDDETYAQAYGEFNDSTWNGKSNYYGKKYGLTGTFNGMGYAIKDMTIGSEREGLFGIVNKGTVKNVAFTDVKAEGSHKYVVAYWTIGATLENIYIRTDAYEKNEANEVTSMGFPMYRSAGIAESYYKGTTMKSCIVEFSTSADSNGGVKGSTIRQYGTGILFSMTGDGTFNCADVYCISANKLGSDYNHMLTNYRGEKQADNTWSGGRALISELDETAINYENGAVKSIKGNRTFDGLKTYTYTDPVLVVSGAYRFETLDGMKAANYTYASLTASGCWTLVDGMPVWG